MLIDDDELTNYVNEVIVEEADCTDKLVTVDSGQDALGYLNSVTKQEAPRPDLILLDVNMPAMNGWEFLEEYKRLGHELLQHTVVVMLTTSFNPEDEEMAKSIGEISDFKNKPLTVDLLQDIISNHF